jgi:hypothetical protein
VPEPRPTRWQKALQDWHRPGIRREFFRGAVGAVVSVIVLLAAGFGHDAAVVTITVICSALATAVLIPAGQFALLWLQAPMRLLTEDVIAIRERLDTETAKAGGSVSRPSVRLTLLNFVAMARPSVSSHRGGEHEAWISEVSQFLAEHCEPRDAESFLREPKWSEQLKILEAIAGKHSL